MSVAPERDNLIYLDDEAWDVDELRDAIRRPRCVANHHPALTPLEVTKLCERVRTVPRSPFGYRRDIIAGVAADFGVSIRTVLRYVKRGRCPGAGCLTDTIGGLLCQFCQRRAA